MPRPLRLRLPRLLRHRWARYALYSFLAIGLVLSAVLVYAYFSFSRMIDERLQGERVRAVPRVYARAVELRRGQAISESELIGRLNDLGYAQRQAVEGPGQFAVSRNVITLSPRGGPLSGRTIRVTFPADGRGIREIDVAGASTSRPAGSSTSTGANPSTALRASAKTAGQTRQDVVALDPPLLTALLTSGAREKRRHVPLDTIPPHVQQAVLAIEDQSFYSHPGVNPVRLMAAAIRNVFSEGDEVVGYSTITQQLARMFFLADEFNAELQSGSRGRTLGSYWRKAREGVMSLVLETRVTKDEILELYLNDVYLGQRGSFAIHGVAEASRIFFGKDVANLSISEAALIAGTIRNPGSGSPFGNAERAMARRNTVLSAMADEAYVTATQAAKAQREPLQIVARAVDNAAPYFVDMVGAQVGEQFPGLTAQPGPIAVYTTLDLNMQRAALDAVRNGLGRVDQLLAARRRKNRGPAQAALIAVDPRTGAILAMVGGRSYNNSQFNRAVTARRQPGSTFKPFVFLAALERAAEEGRTDLTPASLTLDEPAVFNFDGQTWEPRNYDDYDGEITWRRALAMSRNIGTIRVGEQIGFNHIASLWRRVAVGTPPQGYPSITLGVFELTPMEVAEAYTIFTNGGRVRPLRAIDRIETPRPAGVPGKGPVEAAEERLEPKTATLRTVARPDTTYLVTNMMRSVVNEGTAAGARAAGFALDAAGKTGTTNDLRDAWFVGFTPELLTVVWVGFDDNQPLGLSGSQAAVPIWAEFMKGALGGHGNRSFEPPSGVSFAEIDRDTGKRALPGCPRTINESFLAGSEPVEYCELHRW